MEKKELLLPEDFQPGEPVLVSACLIGEKTSWHGGDELCAELVQALEEARVKIIPICPEVLGGLSIPRPPAEPEHGGGEEVLAGGAKIKVVGDGPDRGKDVTPEFLAGAQAALEIARANNARYAFMAERSPSCGVQETHSGGKVINAPGLASAILAKSGITVFGIY